MQHPFVYNLLISRNHTANSTFTTYVSSIWFAASVRGRWGPTLLWHRDPHDFGPTEQPPMVQALLQAPARLPRGGQAAGGRKKRGGGVVE